MILHHFTSLERLVLIHEAGYLRTTESNIGSPIPGLCPTGEHVGPDVVWLADVPEASPRALGLDISLDGTAVNAGRITVEVPDVDAWWWPDFCAEHGINPKWRRILEDGADPESWWVVPRPVHAPEFKEASVLRTCWHRRIRSGSSGGVAMTRSLTPDEHRSCARQLNRQVTSRDG